MVKIMKMIMIMNDALLLTLLATTSGRNSLLVATSIMMENGMTTCGFLIISIFFILMACLLFLMMSSQPVAWVLVMYHDGRVCLLVLCVRQLFSSSIIPVLAPIHIIIVLLLPLLTACQNTRKHEGRMKHLVACLWYAAGCPCMRCMHACIANAAWLVGFFAYYQIANDAFS